MLKQLRIVDFAIVHEVTIVFQPGFTVLTGETGAGKSILIGALELAVGGRSDTDQIRAGSDTAQVEALFDATGPVARWLEENELQGDNDEVIIRRVIARNGRSRAFINGAQTPVAQVKRLGALLVDLHGQHDNQSLFDVTRHLALFDTFAQCAKEKKAYTPLFEAWSTARKRLTALQEDERELARRVDMLRHETEEITTAALIPGEEEKLRKERSTLANAEKLIEAANRATDALDNDERSATAAAGKGLVALREMAEMDEAVTPLADSLASALIQIEETATDLRTYASSLENDPDALECVEDRLDLIRRLKKKYGETLEEVIAYGEEALTELDAIAFDQRNREELEREVDQRGKLCAEAALVLDAARHRMAPQFSAAIEEQLHGLNMGKCSLIPHFTYAPADPADSSPCQRKEIPVVMGPEGIGAMELLFSANPGEPPKPLCKIASGGEISRVMLAIKSGLADIDPHKAMVYDEIDTGIGGVTADRLGEKMASIAERAQVFCITHLAQVARCATHHFVVTKKTSDDSTQVEVLPLNRPARIRELARMAGGDQATAAARAWAEEALQ